ncbi:MAG: DUF2238 domain-containing protein [Phycisphaerales bacterium]
MPARLPTPALLNLSLLTLVLAALLWSAINPHDYPTWALEITPAVVGIAVILATHRRFPLTTLATILVAIHCLILIVGGHYTYARVPLGEWARHSFDLSRNHYDRLGHFAQGFVPAILAREILLRKSPFARDKSRGARAWLFVVILALCMAISAIYELVEWAVAEIDSAGSQAFLGTQGDVWDTQKDMAFCGLGALAALLILPRLHDRLLARIVPGGNRP